MNENAIGKEVIDAAVKVHRGLGPGLLGGGGGQRTQRERIKLRVERQVPVPEGTLAAWRETRIKGESAVPPNVAST